MGWRFPCMIAHELPRTGDFSLADGSRIEFEVKHKRVTRAEVEELLRKRGVDVVIKAVMGREYKDYPELAAGYFEMCKAVFLKDGYHVSILFLFRDLKPINQMQLIVENTQQKYLLMRQLANEVTKTGADAAMIVGESWMAPAESLRAYERPAESPKRAEALTANLVSKTGDPIDCMALIHRNGGVVSPVETVINASGASFEFAPFYHAWGLPIPPSWIDTSKAVMARARRG